MRKLSGLDANFLYMETPATPQHVGSVQYLELEDGCTSDEFLERFRNLIRQRLHLVPFLTSRLQQVPGQLDHPVWIHHPNVDLGWHIQRVTLDAPGSREQLEAAVARLFEPVMRRDRPLWQYWLIDGLADGSVALLNKVHHACIDGMAGTAALYALGDTQPEPRAVAPRPAGFEHAERVDHGALLLDSLQNLTRYAIEQWTRLPSRVEAVARVIQRSAQRGESGHAAPITAPAAPWNRAIDSGRAFASTHMSLPLMKQLAKAADAKINDVVLAVTAEALNRYLERHGISHDADMLAGCPVSLRKPGDSSMNNQVTMVGISMHNRVADPLARIRAVHAASEQAKSLLAAGEGAVQTDFGAPFLPAMLTALARATASGFGMDWLTQTPVNVVVSNVPGPRETMWIAGARMTGYAPISIISHGAGLNVTVCSYVDRMEFGLTASSRLIGDVDLLRDELEAAWDAFVACLPPVGAAPVSAAVVLPTAQAA